MANASIFNAFERMWQHIVVALNDKSEKNHKHEGVGSPFNFLDNSNFTHIINQRGQTEYVGKGYGIDRWYSWHDNMNVTPVSVADSEGNGYIYKYLVLSNSHQSDLSVICQRLEPDKSMYMSGKIFTFAIGYRDNNGYGNIAVCSGRCTPQDVAQGSAASVRRQFSTVVNDDSGIHSIEVFKSGVTQNFEVRINIKPMGSAPILWAALYEGEYTAETLPVYQPKGYMAELNECRRYYQRFYNSVKTGFVSTNSTMLRLGITLPVPLRISSPTLNVIQANGLRTVNGSNISIKDATTNLLTSTSITAYADGSANIDIYTSAVSDITNNTPVALYFSAELNAELNNEEE